MVLSGVVLSSFSAILVKAIELPPTDIALYRCSIATMILALATALFVPADARRLREGWLRPAS